MSYFDFLLKLTDLSLTGLLIFLLYKAVTRMLPEFIKAQQELATNMGRMAVSVDTAARTADSYQASVQMLQEMDRERTKAQTAMVEMFKSFTEDNAASHKMLSILVRSSNEKLERITENLVPKKEG